MSINDDILYKVDSEIGKDKKVVELRKEIERLNRKIMGLNNCIIEFHSEFFNKQTEINRLNNRIEKAIDFLKENACIDEDVEYFCDDLRYDDCKTLLEILRGVDKE